MGSQWYNTPFQIHLHALVMDWVLLLNELPIRQYNRNNAKYCIKFLYLSYSPLDRSLKFSFFRHRYTRQVGRSKYQHKRNPGAKQAGEHFQTTVNYEGYHKKIYGYHKPDENHRSLERCCVVEFAKKNQRDDSKVYRGPNGMGYEGFF